RSARDAARTRPAAPRPASAAAGRSSGTGPVRTGSGPCRWSSESGDRRRRALRSPCIPAAPGRDPSARTQGRRGPGRSRSSPVPPRALQLARPQLLGARTAAAREWRRSQSGLPQGDAQPARGKAEVFRRRPLEHLGDTMIDAPARPAEDQQIAGTELDVGEGTIAPADARKPEHAAVTEAERDDG